jgi:hypothetical protein
VACVRLGLVLILVLEAALLPLATHHSSVAMRLAISVHGHRVFASISCLVVVEKFQCWRLIFGSGGERARYLEGARLAPLGKWTFVEYCRQA